MLERVLRVMWGRIKRGDIQGSAADRRDARLLHGERVIERGGGRWPTGASSSAKGEIIVRERIITSPSVLRTSPGTY